ncbi:hypothetical protein [Salininema proteolyticum]|uniref:Uncharacterized protein n=1 Tax=Salininema proteolyticum TaxID=1607685 RepID=A0ABV8TWG0_9ACTN
MKRSHSESLSARNDLRRRERPGFDLSLDRNTIVDIELPPPPRRRDGFAAIFVAALTLAIMILGAVLVWEMVRFPTT